MSKKNMDELDDEAELPCLKSWDVRLKCKFGSITTLLVTKEYNDR